METHKTDWFHDCRWGVFIHYLNSVQNNPERGVEVLPWSEHVEALDAELLGEQLARVNAGYLVLTIQQRTANLCVPSARFDEISGYAPGEKCARRDLVLDLYEALSKRGIELLLYFTGDGPMDDPQAGAAFGYTSHTEPVSMDFVHKWAGVLEELSTRYGRRIRGWWLDGCHPCIGYDAEKCGIYAEAIRRGNPDAIISFNASVVENVESFSSCDDFTAGERNWFDDMPKGRFLGDTQWHLLSFLGYDARDFQVHAGWAQPNCKYSPEYIHDFVAAAVARDGVVSVDVFMDRYGNIAPKHMEVLNALRDIREA